MDFLMDVLELCVRISWRTEMQNPTVGSLDTPALLFGKKPILVNRPFVKAVSALEIAQLRPLQTPASKHL